MRHAATGLSPGIRECDEAITQVENAVADIEGATMAVAFGNLEGTAGKTHQDCQQELADLTRTLTDALKALEGGDTKRGANILATAVPVMSSLVRTAVATTHNKNTQQSLLTAAKDLSENLLGLLMSVRENASGTGSPAAIGQKAKQTRGAIDNLNSSLRAGADSARQIEQANRDIQEAAKLLTQPADSGVTYKDVKVALKYESQDFVRTVTDLLNSAKVNVDDVGHSARAVASVLPALIRSTRNAAATTPDQKAKAALVANGKKVIETAAQFIAAAQGVNNDPKNRSLHMALAAAASAVTAAVSALLDACYAGATGERECEDAVFQLGRIVADLDACALFAAAGQIDAEEIAPGLTYEVLPSLPFPLQQEFLILRKPQTNYRRVSRNWYRQRENSRNAAAILLRPRLQTTRRSWAKQPRRLLLWERSWLGSPKPLVHWEATRAPSNNSSTLARRPKIKPKISSTSAKKLAARKVFLKLPYLESVV